eukprot:445656_1
MIKMQWSSSFCYLNHACINVQVFSSKRKNLAFESTKQIMSIQIQRKQKVSHLFYPAQFQQISLLHQRQKYDKLSDLYSIILATEHLERMWIKQSIEDDKYYEECQKLLIKFKSLLPVIQPYYSNPIDFFNDYCPELTSAKYRLIDEGDVPYPQPILKPYPNIISQSVIAETVQYFITIIDALELKMCEIDQIYPSLKILTDSLNSIKTIKNNHGCKLKVNQWMLKLQKMKASDKLNDEQMKQIKFDIANAYDQFHAFLKQ